MLAKRIDSSGQRNFSALGRYCRDADHEGEKCLMSWTAGCWVEEYDLALAEIEAVQAMNTRTKKDKTYHLMVSFRPEDEAKLTPEACKKIELAMADALGLSEHQRVCGVHKNTNNLHLHVAYNLIHPEKLTKAEPFQDFYKLSVACRAMEKELNLARDNGIEISDPLAPKIDQRAAAMEAHSGEQSFQSYALDQRAAILAELEEAQSWHDAHRILAAHGITIKPMANGLVLANADGKGKETMKASAFDRGMSKAKLTARFGDYAPPEKTPPATLATSPISAVEAPDKPKYDKKPLQPRSPERDELYKTYQAVLAEKIARIDAEKARSQGVFDGLKERWQQVRGNARGRVYGMMLGIQRRDMAQAKAEHQERLAAIKKDYRWHNWNGFLQSRAEDGDKAALAVLRSQEEKRAEKDAIKRPAPEKIFLTVPFPDKQAAKDAGAKWDKDEKKWYAPKGTDLDKLTAWLSPEMKEQAEGEKIAVATSPISAADSMAKTDESKKKDSGKPQQETTSPVARLLRLEWTEKERVKRGVADKSHFSGFGLRVDNRGVVIISLAAGGTIRDAGNKLHFSPDADTRQAATLYALAKFGQNFSQGKNSIKRQEHGRWRNLLKPHLGILKDAARNGLRTLSQIPVAFSRKGRQPEPEMLLPSHAQPDVGR